MNNLNIFTSLSPGNIYDETYFSKCFEFILQEIKKNNPQAFVFLLENITDLVLSNDENFTINREVPILSGKGRIDIEIESKNSLFFLEFKIGTPLGENQIKNYKDGLKQINGKQNKLLILISKWNIEYNKANTPNIHLKWYNIYKNLKDLSVNNKITKHYIEQFLSYMEALEMKLGRLTGEYENGIKSLLILREQIRFAIENIDPNIKIGDFRGTLGYEGFIIRKSKERFNDWIGIYYEEPTKIYYHLEKVTKKSFNESNNSFFKFIQEYNTPFANFSLIDNNYYSLTPEEQVQMLQHFFEKCIEESKKIPHKLRYNIKSRKMVKV